MKVDYIIILPWNVAEEIREKTQTNAKFVTFIPEVRIYDAQ
jgi:hypothetical protein